MVRELKSMRSQEKYMTWIKDFAKASYGIYAGNTIDAFQPLDFFHFFGLWYDLWLIEVLKAFDKLDVDKKHYKDLKHLLPMPSNMRAILIKAIPSYVGAGKKNKEVYRRFTNFKARMLQEACIEDPFGKYSTPLHRREEVEEIKKITFHLATKAESLYKEIRKKDFDELKLMVMWQECYQLKALLEAAGMDWRPTAEMLDAIKNQPLQTGVLPHGVMMTSLDQYMKEFHLETFEKEVLKN